MLRQLTKARSSGLLGLFPQHYPQKLWKTGVRRTGVMLRALGGRILNVVIAFTIDLIYFTLPSAGKIVGLHRKHVDACTPSV